MIRAPDQLAHQSVTPSALVQACAKISADLEVTG